MPASENVPTAAAPPSWLGALLAEQWASLALRAGVMVAAKHTDSGRYAWVDPDLAAAWGRPAADLAGRTDSELFEADTAAALRAAEQTALAEGGWMASDHRFDVGGRKLDFRVLRLASRPDGDGGRRLVSLWLDRLPQRRLEDQLSRALEQLGQLQQAHEALRRDVQDSSLRDAGSGLSSRGHFDDQLRRELDLSTREHREFALVFIEIDPPSDEVRDGGPPAVERIHEAIGRLLRGNVRAMDAACRLDDARFAVLLSGVGLATAHARMDGLRRQCASQIVVQDGLELGFTVSMGVASFPHTAHTRDELVQACHAALEEATRRGGNRVTLASIRFDSAQ